MKYCYMRKLLIGLFRYSAIPYSAFYSLSLSMFHLKSKNLQCIFKASQAEKTASVARAIAADIVYFFSQSASSSSSSCYHDVLLNVENLNNYIMHLQQEGQAATTITEKI